LGLAIGRKGKALDHRVEIRALRERVDGAEAEYDGKVAHGNSWL